MKKMALLSGLLAILIIALTLNCGNELECVDIDGDGYGKNCSPGPDCNDSNASINPGKTEIYYNGFDDDCDTLNTIDKVQD